MHRIAKRSSKSSFAVLTTVVMGALIGGLALNTWVAAGAVVAISLLILCPPSTSVYVLALAIPVLPLLREMLPYTVTLLGIDFSLVGSAKDILLGCFAVRLLAHVLTRDYRVNRHVLWRVMLLIAFNVYAVCVGVIRSSRALGEVISGYRIFTQYSLIAIGVLLLAPQDVDTKLAIVAALSGLLLTAFGWYQMANPKIIGLYSQSYEVVMERKAFILPGVSRMVSTMLDPNILAFFLLTTASISLSWLLWDRVHSGKRRLIWLGATIVPLTGLIGTYSRNTWGACLVGTSVAGCLILIRRRMLTGAVKLASVGSLIVALSAVALTPMSLPAISVRLRQLGIHSIVQDPRLLRWSTSIVPEVTSSPLNFLFGLGFGEMGGAGVSQSGMVVENLYLNIIYQTGMVGLSLFAAIVGFCWRDAWILWTSETEDRKLGFLGLVFLPIFLTLGVFADVNMSSAVTFYFWAIVGLILFRGSLIGRARGLDRRRNQGRDEK